MYSWLCGQTLTFVLFSYTLTLEQARRTSGAATHTHTQTHSYSLRTHRTHTHSSSIPKDINTLNSHFEQKRKRNMSVKETCICKKKKNVTFTSNNKYRPALQRQRDALCDGIYSMEDAIRCVYRAKHSVHSGVIVLTNTHIQMYNSGLKVCLSSEMINRQMLINTVVQSQ